MFQHPNSACFYTSACEQTIASLTDMTKHNLAMRVILSAGEIQDFDIVSGVAECLAHLAASKQCLSVESQRSIFKDVLWQQLEFLLCAGSVVPVGAEDNFMTRKLLIPAVISVSSIRVPSSLQGYM